MTAKKNSERIIAHLDLDAFFVSVERLRDPSLVGKPVVVGGNPDKNGRGVIAAASYEARRYGIHSAMPSIQAKRLCPQAILVGSRHRLYGLYSKKFFRIIADYTPSIEQTSIDEGYIDITGCEHIFGHPLSLAESLKRRVKDELGLPVSVGIATNKLMAKVGSDYAKPEGIVYIKPGYEKIFLAPMKVQKIPGVGPAALEKLQSYSIHSIGDLNRLGKASLERIFGKHGTALYNASCGIGSASFGSTRARAKSISRERTYGRDTNDRAFIRATLCRLAEKAAADLRDKRLKAGTVTLKLRYSDFKTVTRSRSLSHPTDLDGIIFPVIRELLEDTYQRRTSVRLVGVSLTRLEEETQEILIMEEREEKMGRLCGSLDKIRKKYDDTTVVHARGRLSRQ